ncbi:MAG: DNA-binding response regulator [Alcanivorax sp.]|jgi:DNA-binding response OmpR family regulator|uniref:response regulator transcription factor n=1 Tax=Alcanivorax TaxID=59753 RepID=UPI000789D089|nr:MULTISPECIES: response regulator transcription factor [Alcanivorax]MCK5919469.1 response regulator transcription factor [Methylococcales bacterium]MEE2602339.1 response regulator transcription factor [Pseudomonadota bacterium]MBB10221.1 DNA-binding response regulator [Alcanivorax sp.]MBU84098.1 DNA-binding response regulator [Alcanivorax sp.]MEE3388060.1 response regulator transcription factor [Pseudomonadota bacterium]|tara:strand:- start:1242 stop:1916 length:675 start_codon:yes stop_codon:yes gene_type:complete
MKILIVEDEERLASFLFRGLKAEGYFCDVASDGEKALQACLSGDYELVILDRMLPKKDGMYVLTKIKEKKPETKVLMLTALDDTEDRILGLRSGADDYLGKPFDFEELLARIEALSRRFSQHAEDLLKSGDVVMDVDQRLVWKNNIVVKMTQMEFDLLRYFLTNQGKVLSREKILSRVWSNSEDPMTNIVDVYIRRIRVKLNDDGSFIETVRGVGYRVSNSDQR